MYIVIDLETTGLHPEKGDAILDIAAIKVFENGSIEKFQTFVHPGGREVPEFILALTGISMDSLVNAPKESEAFELLRSFLGKDQFPLVGHNVQFDINFLKIRGFDLSAYQTIDTNDLSTLFIPEAPSHSLEVLALGFDIAHREKHTAMGDVLATDELLRILKKRYLEKYKDSFSSSLLKIRDKFPNWDGLLFFDLNIPDPVGKHIFTLHEGTVHKDIVAMQKTASEGLENISQNALYVFPNILSRADLLKSVTMDNDAVLVLPYSNIDLYKDDYNVFIFDHTKNILSNESIAFAFEHATESEALFFLRYFSLLPHDEFFHIARFTLTHGERKFISKFSLELGDDELKEKFRLFLSQKKSVITNHKEYFYGDFHENFSNEKVIIDDYSLLEHYLFAMSRKSISFDYLAQILGELKDMLSKEVAKTFENEFFSLENIARYFFSNTIKGMSGNPSTSKDMFQEQIRTFINSFFKGLSIIFDALPEEDGGRKTITYMRTLLIDLFEHEEEGFYYYFYNNPQMGLSFIKEVVSMEPYIAKLKTKNVSYFDTKHLEKFPYMFEIEDVVDLIPRTWNEKISITEVNQHVHGEQDDLALVSTNINRKEKTLLIGGAAMKLEKVFDYYFNSYSHEGFYTAFPGKSGGRSKVVYRFESEKEALLLYQWKDVPSLVVHSLDKLMILHIPFTVFAGKYFQEKYANQSFMKLTVPLASKQMNDLFDGLLRSQYERGINVDLLDQRLYQKEYGKEIIRGIT